MKIDSYYIWRTLNIAVKPFAIFISARLVDPGVANIISLAILLSTTLMASLSFGSYKYLLKSKSNYKIKYFSNYRVTIFYLNVLLLAFIALIASHFIAVEYAFFILFFVISEHIIHDDSRLHLYKGARVTWIKNTFFKTLFIPIIPLVLFTFSDTLNILEVGGVVLVSICAKSWHEKGIVRLNWNVVANVFRKSFYRRYLLSANYFLSATTNKFNQLSDRYLYTFISFETFWIYSLLCQIAALPLMLYEMSAMSRLKERIITFKTLPFEWLKRSELKVLVPATLVSLSAFFVATFIVHELVDYRFFIMFGILMAGNFLAAISMKNSERLFWFLDNPRKFFVIELRSMFIAFLMLAPVVIYTQILILVKLPSYLSMSLKVWSARRCLK